MGDSGSVPFVPVLLTVLEIGYLTGRVSEPADKGDPVARALYKKLKAAAVEGGVVWRYGAEPWEAE